jgi:DNA-binding MarR family transcriptional regulator
MKKLVLENFLPYRLNCLASAVSRDFKAVYGRHYDLTVPEWRVLATLGQFGSGRQGDRRPFVDA